MALNRELLRLEGITRSPIISYYSETIQGLTSIRSLKAQESFIERENHFYSENLKNNLCLTAAGEWFIIRLDFASLLTFTMPCLALNLLFKNLIPPGISGLILTYCFSLERFMFNTFFYLTKTESSLVSFERCFAYTSLPTERILDSEPALHNAIKNWPTAGEIILKDFTARYQKGLDPVLNSLNCIIHPGEKIGLVGRTGCGKSSFILSLLRILEADSGYITIDDIDISYVGLHDLRAKITLIPQDSYLFEGTLRENLDPLGKHSEEEIKQAMEDTSLMKTFEYKGGLGFKVSENGDNVSAGEKQLISIARALLKKSKIVLLDEATSSIDVVTESVIEKAMKEQFSNCTVITIAHRLNTVISSDRIMVLDKGHIAEFKSPKELLLDHNSLFYHLWKEAYHPPSEKELRKSS
eukprot:TRINITY_DN9905_c0_g1_i2.p1 TRINITY_DN9905_c0_g1~~TRINITY_DN9905_c0_g1_i2.p1  ORF type:complete len:412 (+),score=69.58 TRINITY_DN9905_c0_g1_i2:272-1507(+)